MAAAAAAEAFIAASLKTADDDPVDEDGYPVMTHLVVSRIVREAGGYRAPAVNEKLWIHNRRFKRIENLEKFTGVAMLHLENNQIENIGPGLRHMSKLKALYLNCNMLRKVDVNLAANENLSHLNLATNQIASFEPDGLPSSLNTILVAANCLETAASIAPLANLPNLEVLDLQNNKLDGEDLFDLFPRFTSLRVLYLIGNPIQRAEYYRKRLVSRCKALTYLDTNPVGDLEKRGAEAWATGGRDAELEARKKYQDDKRAAQRAATRRIAAERAARRAAASLAPDGSGRKVLTPEMMAMLPVAVLTDEWAEALGEDECPVCQAALGSGERVLPLEACSHVFHLSCLKPWLTQASATCPLCRVDVKPTPEAAGQIAAAAAAAAAAAVDGAATAEGAAPRGESETGEGEAVAPRGVLTEGRAAEVSGRVATDLELSRSGRILQVSQALIDHSADNALRGRGGGGNVGGSGVCMAGPGMGTGTGFSSSTSGEREENASQSALTTSAPSSTATDVPIPGRWIRAPVSNYVLSMPSCGATPSPGGMLAGNDYTDGSSTGEGGEVLMTEDGDGDGDDKDGEGCSERPQLRYTEGQQETNRVIQLQLRRRFAQLSAPRAAVEADQFYSTVMFTKLKERRAQEQEIMANSSGSGGSGVGNPASSTSSYGGTSSRPKFMTKGERGTTTTSVTDSKPSSSSMASSSYAAGVEGQNGGGICGCGGGSGDDDDGDGEGSNSFHRDGGDDTRCTSTLDEGNMSVAQRIAFAAKIAGVGARTNI